MATTLKTKNSVTAASAPSSLAQGELAVNITDKKLWVGNAATTPVQLLGAGSSGSFSALSCTSLTDSGLTAGRVTYATTGGLLTDSANMTFDGADLTLGGNLLSSVNAGKNLGSTSNRWANIYVGAVSDGASSTASLLDSASTTVRHAVGSVWAAQAFYTGATERMRIDSSGNLLVNTIGTIRSGKLSVSGDISNNSNIYWGATGNGRIFSDVNWGCIFTADRASPGAADYLWQNAGGTERMRIPSTGGLQVVSSISVGNANPTTSGAGVTFPATQSASSDANTLDDYEEGSWTPSPSAQSGSLTTATATGTYVKIGKNVTISARIFLTTVGTASGQLNVGGLPFIAQNAAGSQNMEGVVREAASTGYIYFIVVINNSNSAAIQSSTNGGISWQNGYIYDFSATYISAS